MRKNTFVNENAIGYELLFWNFDVKSSRVLPYSAPATCLNNF